MDLQLGWEKWVMEHAIQSDLIVSKWFFCQGWRWAVQASCCALWAIISKICLIFKIVAFYTSLCIVRYDCRSDKMHIKKLFILSILFVLRLRYHCASWSSESPLILRREAKYFWQSENENMLVYSSQKYFDQIILRDDFKKNTSYSVTLKSLKVGGGQDETTLLGAAKIVTS